MAKNDLSTKDQAKRLAVYAGQDYKKPKRIGVACVDIDSDDTIDKLMTKLTIFKMKVDGSEIENEERYLEEGGSVLTGYRAYRMETAEEVNQRVADYLQSMLEMEVRRSAHDRLEYERLKPIFEPAKISKKC